MTEKTIDQLNNGSARLNQAIYDAIDHHVEPPKKVAGRVQKEQVSRVLKTETRSFRL